MTRIGKFTRNSDGSFVGAIITLSVQAGNVRIVPDAHAGPHGLTYRVLVGAANTGKGSVRADGNLRLALDDPSFAAAIEADMVEQTDSSFDLLWNRPGRLGDC